MHAKSDSPKMRFNAQIREKSIDEKVQLISTMPSEGTGPVNWLTEKILSVCPSYPNCKDWSEILSEPKSFLEKALPKLLIELVVSDPSGSEKVHSSFVTNVDASTSFAEVINNKSRENKLEVDIKCKNNGK